MTFLIFSIFPSTPRTCPKNRDKNTVILLQPRANVGNGAVYIVLYYIVYILKSGDVYNIGSNICLLKRTVNNNAFN